MTRDETRALYVYCFVRAGTPPPISSKGIDGESEVTTLDLGEIAAVTSPIVLEEFLGPGGEVETPDLEWVAPRAMRHEQVIEEAMESSPVLPLTFGVVFSSGEALASAVSGHRRRIASFLDYIEDKEEWAVKVYANAEEVRAHVEHSDEFLQRLGRPPDAPGARYLHEKRLRRELDRVAADARRQMVERIRTALEPGAVEEKRLRLSPPELTGRRDDMVLNAAFLEAEGQVEPFLQRVETLAEEYRPRGLTIEVSGPWPPFNFCPALGVGPP